MTVPFRGDEPTVVKVALDARGYDIVIGRGVIGSLGARIKALRPGAKAAVVTDATVAKLYLAAAEEALGVAGIESSQIEVPPGEKSKDYATF
jgi:3-dehydroquinate synthetase